MKKVGLIVTWVLVGALVIALIVTGLGSGANSGHEHIYSSKVIDATCTESGYTKFTCSCGHSYNDNFIEAKGHSYKQSIKKATCTEDGYTKFTCSCGYSYNGNFIQAKGHSYKQSIKKATCIEKGYTEYICDCGDSYIGSYTNYADHEYKETIISYATCSIDGVKRYECICGDKYEKSYSLEEKTGSQIYELLKKSVGEIITYDKSGDELALGTCFVYSTDGEIITNYHVIEDAYSANITIDGKSLVVKQILAYDKTADLAILKVDNVNLNAVNICTKEHVVGKVVYAIGSSKGLTSTFSQGIITYANREIDGVHYVQHDSAISSGNSGGPLVNGYGEVIGINTMTIRDSQNLNFAIMINEVNGLDLSKPLTFDEFYEKESNVFKKLKNYIISNGEYESNGNYYNVDFTSSYWNSSYNYMTGASYYLSDNEIRLTNFVYKKTNAYDSMMTSLTIKENISGIYTWAMVEGYSNFMTGTIYANTFTSSTVLNYTSKTGFYYSTYTYREIASQMIYTTLEDMSIDYSSIGITAQDLGFYYVY